MTFDDRGICGFRQFIYFNDKNGRGSQAKTDFELLVKNKEIHYSDYVYKIRQIRASDKVKRPFQKI